MRSVQPELKDEKIEGGLEKAMQSYQRFLEETPDSAMTPEAIRRIADLTIKKEYDADDEDETAVSSTIVAPKKSVSLEQPTVVMAAASGTKVENKGTSASRKISKLGDESEKDFEKRIAQGEAVKTDSGQGFAAPVPEGEDDLDNANAEKAIVLYKKLLKKYPLYERNDQVLYQMSRAHEELGQVEAAMTVMNRLVKEYPTSKYMNEVQFRRAEYFFTRKKYLDSEEAYQSIVTSGPGSNYFELAIYKLGWSFYKQELYEEALNNYFALLDHKVTIGYDFEQKEDQGESKRIEDTYRVISLSFSNLGGAEEVVDYFSRHGPRSYEDKVYSHLGEFYLAKRRYSDAAASYKAFIDLYAFHEVSPHFNMRVIEIYKKGGFAKLVVEGKKQFAETYALDSEYWSYFDVSTRPDVIGFLKENLKDLANHYHALYQDKRFVKEKSKNYSEALLWYGNYLASFPKETESPAINYQMADLMLENKDYGQAAIAYENTAYNYPLHEKSSAAGYAAVYAYREQLKVVIQADRGVVKQQVIRSSLKFADTYPEHEKVTIVLGAAADDLYEMKSYELAVKTAHKLIDSYPDAEKDLVRSAWLVVGHGSFDLRLFANAEIGYINVLNLTAETHKSRVKLLDNLAASIYKQGEEANLLKDYRMAADHFLRIGKLAPQSKIRATAEYDAAAALIQLEDWDRTAEVLKAFRINFPNHELQPDVTKKMAFVYRSAGKLELAAAEYERIERESKDDDVRRGALVIAAELYLETGSQMKELAVYNRYVGFFPRPVEQALEIYSKIANVYKVLGDNGNYIATLNKIVSIDSTAGEGRTDRTRYLAAQAALVITEPLYYQFTAIKLVQPLKKTLRLKKDAMKTARTAFSKLIDYEVADVTAAVTYYFAEIYYDFSRALMTSERPTNLNELEMEQYELALEDQIYPFEEKSIDVHKKNIELLYDGVYSSWIDKSIAKLAVIFPAAYARKEESTGFIETIDSFSYVVKNLAVATAVVPASDTNKVAGDAPVSTNTVEMTGGADIALEEEGTPDEAPAYQVVAPGNAVPIQPAPVEGEPEAAAPVEAESVEAESVEAEPVEAAPIEAEPVEAEPVEAAPVEAEPVEAEPVEAEPVEGAPVEAEPVEAAPVEAEPVEAEPIEAEPVEAAPAEAESVEAEPVEAEPVEAEPVEAEPVEAEPVEAEPVEAAPVEAAPVEAEPVEVEPVEVEPVEVEPVEVEPVEVEPVEVEPVEAAPVEAEAVEAEAVEAEPVEAEAVEAEPVEAEAVEAEPVEAEAVEAEAVEAEPVSDGLVETSPIVPDGEASDVEQ
ncbi:MAG: tetratricopeptide repeat protein [Pseudomonadota bacterium]